MLQSSEAAYNDLSDFTDLKGLMEIYLKPPEDVGHDDGQSVPQSSHNADWLTLQWHSLGMIEREIELSAPF